jgi:polyribonucleotide nucleotidyltransferase
MVAAAKIGYIDGEYILNPSVAQIAESKLELVVAGTDSSVMMVESEAKQLNEKEMLAAVEFGHKAFQPVIKMIEKIAKKAGKEKWPEFAPIVSNNIIAEVEKKYKKDIEKAYSLADKIARYSVFDEIMASITEDFASNTEVTKLQLKTAFEEVKYKILRSEVLTTGKRIDGRKSTDIRSIDTMVSLLPRTHGSALFTRGETQGLVVTTLGTGQDEQIIDGLDGDSKERFLLHYIFPPYSVGEATPFRAPGRREVGHGKLAWRALKGVLPSKEEFPYTVRVVSEITESNGSSSMATVCGASMAMMDAGVPLKAPVAGIAMGLIKEGKDFVVLSDILGDEDHLGDMDFKVAGTKDGITALQMDIKISGITIAIMKQALDQANAGRLHILGRMADSITTARTSVSTHAPMIVSFKIDKDKIREVIGSGGKVIKEICEVTGAKIDITDDGMVSVAAVGSDKVNDAVSRIKAIAIDPEFGQIFDGTVAKVLDSGAFINYLPGKDGFIHISEVADERIESIHDRLSDGQKVKVKIIGIDQKGKAKLSMRLDFAHIEKNDKREERPSRDNRSRDDRGGDRRDNRDRGNRDDNRGNRSESSPRENTRENPPREQHKDEERSEAPSDKPAPRKRKAPKSDENSSQDTGSQASGRKYFR